MVFFFFFSSRRRHTRWPRDWSSDVCSSDLRLAVPGGILRTSAGGNLLARDRMRIAGAPAPVTSHQVHMDVIVMIDVRPRCQHGIELFAGSALHVAQKALLFGCTPPAILHRNLASVREREGGDIKRIAEGMLGNARAWIAVHAAARIGGDLSNLDHRLAEPLHGRRLHGPGDPLVKRGDDWTSQRRRRAHGDWGDRPGHWRTSPWPKRNFGL